MRWIITTDYMGGCLGLGENGEGIPARAEVSQGHGLPMEFRLYNVAGFLCFEGRCGDIDADWWHGFEPLMFTWNTHARCRRMSYRRTGSQGGWRRFKP